MLSSQVATSLSESALSIHQEGIQFLFLVVPKIRMRSQGPNKCTCTLVGLVMQTATENFRAMSLLAHQ